MKSIHIVGAGVIGLVCGLTLLKAGFSVTLYDKAPIAGQGASRLAGAMIAPITEAITGAFDAGLLGKDSAVWWKDVCGDAFHQTGSILVSGMGRASLDHVVQKATILGLQDKIQHLTQIQMTAEIPDLCQNAGQGLFIAEEGFINPEMAFSILQQQIEKKGGRFVFNMPPCMAVDQSKIWIDCTGMGAVEALDGNLRGVKGERLIIKAPWFRLNHAVRWLHPRFPFYIVPRGGGLFSVGATMTETDERNVLPTVGGTLHILAGLGQLFPPLLEAEIVAVEADLRPSFTDNLPRIQEKDGIFYINGAYRHGFLLAPVLAKQLINNL